MYTVRNGADKLLTQAKHLTRILPQKSRGTEMAFMFFRAVWYFS